MVDRRGPVEHGQSYPGHSCGGWELCIYLHGLGHEAEAGTSTRSAFPCSCGLLPDAVTRPESTTSEPDFSSSLLNRSAISFQRVFPSVTPLGRVAPPNTLRRAENRQGAPKKHGRKSQLHRQLRRIRARCGDRFRSKCPSV